jgi:glycosyltransferase involved in cell wall biosynthesis
VAQTNWSESGSRVDVLHISEAYGGGVQSAISRYIEHSAELEHRILVRMRSEHDIEERNSVEITGFNGSMPAFLLHARAVILRTRPRIVHLHSSFAGLLRTFRFGDTKIIYTPHAYAFLRRDQSSVARAAYLGVETMLSRRPQTIAAISPFEAASAARISGGVADIAYLPNVAADHVGNRRTEGSEAKTREVVMVGRISAQKDPSFFAAMARAVRADIRWRWVGDGDPEMKKELEAAGVEVTGWMPNDVVHDHIAGADLYFHSAQWEGAPITLLESAALGTPILARGIDCLEGLGFPLTADCPLAAARAVERFFFDARFRQNADNATRESVAIHSPKVQSDALGSLYRRAG